MKLPISRENVECATTNLWFKLLEICGSYMWVVPYGGKRGKIMNEGTAREGRRPSSSLSAPLYYSQGRQRKKVRGAAGRLPTINQHTTCNQPSTHSAVSLFPPRYPLCGGKVLSNSSSRTLMVTPPWLPNSINLIFMKIQAHLILIRLTDLQNGNDWNLSFAPEVYNSSVCSLQLNLG